MQAAQLQEESLTTTPPSKMHPTIVVPVLVALGSGTPRACNALLRLTLEKSKPGIFNTGIYRSIAFCVPFNVLIEEAVWDFGGKFSGGWWWWPLDESMKSAVISNGVRIRGSLVAGAPS